MLQALLLKPAISFACVLFWAEVQVMAITIRGIYAKADENAFCVRWPTLCRYMAEQDETIPDHDPCNMYGL
jgi:hypothetical protein